jgi:hypothetical protein
MTTTVVHSIGTASRDYSTIAAWYAAAPLNLTTADQIWRGECYKDAEFTTTSTLITVSGSTVVDATRYLLLTTGTGQGYKDNATASAPLRYDATLGVGLRWTSGYGSIISDAHGLVIDGLQISYDSSSSSNYTPPIQGLRAMHNCLYESRQTANNSINFPGEIVNSVICMRGTTFSGTAVRPTSDSPGVDHLIANTIVRPSDLTAGGTGISGGGDGYPVVCDNAVFGFTTAFAGTMGSYPAGTSNNASDVASGSMPGTANQASLSAGAQFQSSTDTARDWRPTSGGALFGNGIRQQTYTNDLDIVGASRGVSGTAIGARAYVAVAATIDPGGLSQGATGYLSPTHGFGRQV